MTMAVINLFFFSEGCFPHQQQMPKLRFCSYRIIILGWLYPDLKTGKRRQLPTCMYSEIQQMLPPTEDKELFAGSIGKDVMVRELLISFS